MSFGVKLNPHAICQGPNGDGEGCKWTYPHSPNARSAAKDHVKHTGHVIVVEQINRDTYERQD